jgi:hypothetical protein
MLIRLHKDHLSKFNNFTVSNLQNLVTFANGNISAAGSETGLLKGFS